MHGITPPELDQTFWRRGEPVACGTMSLAALEALIAGVKVRCEVVERDRHRRQGLLAQWGQTSAAGRCRRRGHAGGVEGLRRRPGRGA